MGKVRDEVDKGELRGSSSIRDSMINLTILDVKNQPMKNITSLLLIIFTTLSCSDKKESHNRNIKLNDTITTFSGLKYIFLKEGIGRKVEIGTKVKAYYDLYINDADTIFESTSENKDSIFEFIHGSNAVIEGFSELNSYLIEGDEVIAIIPDSLAYGEEGSGGVPANATLIYKPYIIKYVPEPKEILSDTLYILASTKNAKEAINFYEKVINSNLKNNYHTDDYLMFILMDKMNQDSLYSEMEYLADYLSKTTDDPSLNEYFIYFKILALEEQGKMEEAITIIEPLIETGHYKDLWQENLKRLEEKLESQ